MTAYLLVALIAFAAVFTQSVSGFGSALVAMPLLTALFALTHAAPLMALVAGTLQLVLIFHYRRHLAVGAVWRICLASLFAIPLGIWALRSIDQQITLAVLGAVVLAYAVYALLTPRLPEMKHPGWAYGAGFLGGLLGGAYNTNGPPVVIYGNCRRWTPQQFKANLQVFFMFNNVFILIGHALYGNLSASVGRHYLAALPGIGVGLAVGLSLDRFINAERFRKVVLVLLIVLGLHLIVRALAGV